MAQVPGSLGSHFPPFSFACLVSIPGLPVSALSRRSGCHVTCQATVCHFHGVQSHEGPMTGDLNSKLA